MFTEAFLLSRIQNKEFLFELTFLDDIYSSPFVMHFLKQNISTTGTPLGSIGASPGIIGDFGKTESLR